MGKSGIDSKSSKFKSVLTDKNAVKKIISIIKGPNGSKTIMVVGIIGILLIGLSSILPKKAKPQKEQKQLLTEEQTTELYTKKLESEVSDLISQVNGAGKAEVMITLASGKRYVYADESRVGRDKQEKSGSSSQREDTERSIVIIDTKDGKKGLLITELEPQVKGVVVVCEGGDNLIIKEKITTLLATLLDLPTKRVCVVKLKTS